MAELPPSKKRPAGKEISRDNPELDDDGDDPPSSLTFTRASEEVLTTRRIIKVRRTTGTASAAPNPFASVQLIAPSPPADAAANGKPSDAPVAETAAEGTCGVFSSFKQLSGNENAFAGLAGGGATCSFGRPENGEPSPPLPFRSFNFSGGNSTVFGDGGVAVAALAEVPHETGEEGEESVFQAESVLYEFISGAWKERGKGDVKVNVSTADGRRGGARLVMRTRGNYRLVLNSYLFPDTTLTDMDRRGVTFSARDGDSLATFALKFKDVDSRTSFRSAVEAHKGPPASPPPVSSVASDVSHHESV